MLALSPDIQPGPSGLELIDAAAAAANDQALTPSQKMGVVAALIAKSKRKVKKLVSKKGSKKAGPELV